MPISIVSHDPKRNPIWTPIDFLDLFIFRTTSPAVVSWEFSFLGHGQTTSSHKNRCDDASSTRQVRRICTKFRFVCRAVAKEKKAKAILQKKNKRKIIVSNAIESNSIHHAQVAAFLLHLMFEIRTRFIIILGLVSRFLSSFQETTDRCRSDCFRYWNTRHCTN